MRFEIFRTQASQEKDFVFQHLGVPAQLHGHETLLIKHNQRYQLSCMEIAYMLQQCTTHFLKCTLRTTKLVTGYLVHRKGESRRLIPPIGDDKG